MNTTTNRKILIIGTIRKDSRRINKTKQKKEKGKTQMNLRYF